MVFSDLFSLVSQFWSAERSQQFLFSPMIPHSRPLSMYVRRSEHMPIVHDVIIIILCLRAISVKQPGPLRNSPHTDVLGESRMGFARFN